MANQRLTEEHVPSGIYFKKSNFRQLEAKSLSKNKNVLEKRIYGSIMKVHLTKQNDSMTLLHTTFYTTQ